MAVALILFGAAIALVSAAFISLPAAGLLLGAIVMAAGWDLMT